jgi:hypothetical protein
LRKNRLFHICLYFPEETIIYSKTLIIAEEAKNRSKFRCEFAAAHLLNRCCRPGGQHADSFAQKCSGMLRESEKVNK